MRGNSFAHVLTVTETSIPDVDLLARFAETSDPAAFELLVRRSAEPVWRVSRSEPWGDRRSAEDAIQTTFRVLARKAGRVREPSAAGFLVRVARNAAVRERGRAGRVAEALGGGAVNAPRDPVEPGECSAVIMGVVPRPPDRVRHQRPHP